MGIDFGVKEVDIGDGVTVELYLFDVAGEAMYRGIMDQYLENISYFIFVYDVSNKNTFERSKAWIEKCRKTRKDLPGVCIANKIDLDDRIEVPDFQGTNLCKSQGLEFFQTSAFRSQNLTAPFEFIAKQFHKSYEEKLRTLKQDM
eukprot:TRINITY_DN29305_c0_g1_i1.p1 TRINITY_DN29305_c0_g1~~TRINITY_DN29305_c0_g1_i1.p1  ORF type:complete len:169 (+),score=52.67 TRINITY_DN29305_c0_g1_i1:73-507(+)